MQPLFRHAAALPDDALLKRDYLMLCAVLVHLREERLGEVAHILLARKLAVHHLGRHMRHADHAMRVGIHRKRIMQAADAVVETAYLS